jgi:DNA-binding response OmpR family regulator
MMISSSANPVTIVMIEDDEGHARLIERNIRRAGVSNRIEKFSTAREGMRFLAQDSGPVLVLLDLNLPDASGIDVLNFMRSRQTSRTAPVIVLTTTDDEEEVQRCYDLGCNAYITKPVDYQSFAAAIQQLGVFLTFMEFPVRL